jgi:hypothetical protein
MVIEIYLSLKVDLEILVELEGDVNTTQAIDSWYSEQL